MLSMLFFVLQSVFKYAFLGIPKYANQWKWFYHANDEISKIKTNPFHRKAKSNDSEKHYLKGLSDFIEQYTNEDLESEIESNVIQLYLLKVHNYYKNKFYLQLAGILKYEIFATFVLIIASIVATFIVA